MSRKSDETYMSVHPANLLADWHFREFRRQADRPLMHEAAYEDIAWPLEQLGEEQPLPARRSLAGSIWARLQGATGGLRRIERLLRGVWLPPASGDGMNEGRVS
jgi:hypothetical protein